MTAFLEEQVKFMRLISREPPTGPRFAVRNLSTIFLREETADFSTKFYFGEIASRKSLGDSHQLLHDEKTPDLTLQPCAKLLIMLHPDRIHNDKNSYIDSELQSHGFTTVPRIICL
jgi:hypothetical protein